eukprot:9038360-Heterocapsa_arctica.AAC.1
MSAHKAASLLRSSASLAIPSMRFAIAGLLLYSSGSPSHETSTLIPCPAVAPRRWMERRDSFADLSSAWATMSRVRASARLA